MSLTCFVINSILYDGTLFESLMSNCGPDSIAKTADNTIVEVNIQNIDFIRCKKFFYSQSPFNSIFGIYRLFVSLLINQNGKKNDWHVCKKMPKQGWVQELTL